MGQGSSAFATLEKDIGYYFRNKDLLTEAFSHDSLLVVNTNLPHYQRLEHLGDAVIHFVITNYLFTTFPKWDEGRLSNKRADLVCQSKQKQIATRLNLSQFVKMAPGVIGFSRYDKFLEALIGAIFMDAGGEERGYPEVKKVIYKLWELF